MFYIPERLKSFDSCLHLGRKFCEKTHTCTTLFCIKYRVRNGHWSHTKFQLWLWNSISPNPLFRLLDRLSETAVFDIIGILSRICCSLVLVQVLYVSCLQVYDILLLGQFETNFLQWKFFHNILSTHGCLHQLGEVKNCRSKLLVHT